MRATVMRGAGDVRIEDVPDASVVEPTNAVVRITHACVCGSDLWPYKTMARSETGHTSGIHGGFFGTVGVPGAQAEAVRVPQADGTLVVLPAGEDDALIPSLLTLSDVWARATTPPSPPRSVGSPTATASTASSSASGWSSPS